MPCYTVKKTTVNVSNMDVSVLADGLKAAGFDVKLDGQTVIFSRTGTFTYHTYQKGTLQLRGSDVESLTAEVKRAFSAQVVRQTAKQFGWQLSSKSTTEFVAQKRR
jgi:ribonuclease HIII